MTCMSLDLTQISACRDKEEASMREQARRKAVVADRAKETQAAIAEQIREKAAKQKAAANLARREADETARRVQVHACTHAGLAVAA